ncbi:MAG: hypothetical protein ACI9C1_002356 [Candidatus Aldehydirespiratoraceae bacterium]|jgi:hypothetical protein
MTAVFRRVIAGLILGPALLIGSFAWWGFLAQRTVLDETRTQTIAEELLDNDAVVDQIGKNIGRAIEGAVPDPIELTEEQVQAAVAIILADPVVRSLIIESLGTTHRAFLGLDDAPSTIDLGPALASSREGIGVFNPVVANALPAEFVVELPTERVPDASPVKDFLARTVPVLATISLAMALLAFLTTSDRSHVLGKAARWAIGTTAFYLIVGLGVPYLLRQVAPDGAEVFAALLTAVLRAALLPSIVLGIIGAVLLLLSIFWPDPDRTRAATAPPRERVDAAAPASRPDAQPPARATAPVAQPQAQPRPVAPAPVPRPAARPQTDPTMAIPIASPPTPTLAPPPIIPTPPPVIPAPRDPFAPASRPNPIPAPGDLDPTAPRRPTLPTRAKPPESTGLPAWTGEAPTRAAPEPEPIVAATKTPRWLPPTWVPEHGWVMDPNDPREAPNNARFVDGVGWVVPGPPPAGG